MSIQITMMASRRDKPYVQHSLASLFEKDHIDVPVRVVCCDDNPDFVGPWLDDPRVRVEAVPPDEYAGYADKNIYWKITETFLRCLRPAAECGDGVVLLQDDVSLARNWLRTVRHVEKTAQRQLELRYQKPEAAVILALFSSGRMPAQHTPIAPYVPHKFFGNVGLYMSKKVIAPLVACAEQNHGEMDDMVVKRFMMDGGAHLYAVNPNIVQHTGDRSTHGGGYYRSPTFKEAGHRI